MARIEKLLASMRRNPRNDWSIDDIQSICRAYDIACDAPKRGSHYQLRHPRIPGRLTIPARRPIKPVYILLLLEMLDALESQ